MILERENLIFCGKIMKKGKKIDYYNFSFFHIKYQKPFFKYTYPGGKKIYLNNFNFSLFVEETHGILKRLKKL